MNPETDIMIIGTTFSHRQSRYLKLKNSVFQDLLDLGFGSIRLGCYWDEIEKKKGKYDFSEIVSLLDQCEERGQNVIVTLGMKAPRWPEFYFPSWLSDKTPSAAHPYVIPLMYKSLEVLKKYSCITHWQVENEPLDPSGPQGMSVPFEMLSEEVAIVREKDTRPIVVNLWGNELKKRKHLLTVKNIADVIGLDIYYKVPVFGPIYRGPLDSDATIKRMSTQAGKPVFITELQAEPWERTVLKVKSGKTPSMNEEILRDNVRRARSMKPDAIYLWGSEYWFWRSQTGDASLLHTVQELIANTA